MSNVLIFVLSYILKPNEWLLPSLVSRHLRCVQLGCAAHGTVQFGALF